VKRETKRLFHAPRFTFYVLRFTNMDSRTVPAHEGRAVIRERASRFLSFVSPASTPEEAGAFVARLKKEYHDATHVAFAWRVGSGDSAQERASDAGEPSGTAGKPIAAAIASAGVTDVVTVVVRYFGGTKLGTGGLSRAYRRGAEAAIAAAERKTLLETILVVVTCAYERLGSARRLLRPPEITLAAETFEPDPVLRFEVLRSRLPGLLADLEEARLPYEIVSGG
jgi:uncharacterized YigZ family protein